MKEDNTMTEKTQRKIFQTWTPRLMLRLLKNGVSGERRDIRDRLVKYIDQRGLNLTDAATLHTFENSEKMRDQLDQLLTPRPGERTNLEKILTLLEALVRSNAQILKGQASLDARLAEIELQITEWNGYWASQSSVQPSTDS
jgi:hypothetical protein